MAARSRVALTVCVLASSACSAAPLTQIFVVSDTDMSVPDQLDTIRILVTDEQGSEREARADLVSGAPRPVTLGLVSRSPRTMEIVVLGEHEGIEILRRTARVTFRPGRTLALRMDLWARCRGELCGADRTCGDAGCRGVQTEDEDLTDFDGELPPPREPSADAGDMDGGAGDAGRGADAAAPMDAAWVDAAWVDASWVDAASFDAGAPVDARVGLDATHDAYVRPDAWSLECTSAAQCDDGWTCTLDTCIAGTCRHEARDSACDDRIPCTSEVCDVELGCLYETHDERCDDGVMCTVDVCNQLAGCRSRATHALCAAGSFCDLAGGCQTAPTFAEVYSMVIQPRCGPCHITSMTRAGRLDLSTEEMAYEELVGVTAECGGGVNTIVIPGDSARSLLWRKVAAVDLCGSRMPRGASMPLDPALAQVIERWIQAGALR